MRNPKKGKMYGETFITQFNDDIAEMFECIEYYKGDNITAVIIEVYLQRINPDE